MRPTIRLLGTMAVRDADSWTELPSHKTVALLARLALEDGFVHRDVLSALFWPESEASKARTNLRSLIARARAHPGGDALETCDDRVRWNVDTDVQSFRDLTDRERWDEAMDIYRADLLEGMAFSDAGRFHDWLELERERLRDSFRTAAMRWTHSLLKQGRGADASYAASRLLSRDPWNEDALRLAMRAHAAAGSPAHALELFRAFARELADELDLKPSPVTVALADSLREGSTALSDDAPVEWAVMRLQSSTLGGAAPPPDDDPAEEPPPPLSVHAPITTFVGRTKELLAVLDRLSRPECRLLTLVGTGGVGKTRLAIHAARAAGSRYPDGAVFVSLENVDSPEGVPAAIAEGLGLMPRSREEAIERLVEALAPRALLLVLDNFEQVLDARDVVSTLVKSCPAVDALVTSRARLGLSEEWLLPLLGLDYPDAEYDLETASRAGAVRCIVERIRQVRPDFELDAATLPHIVNVCRSVDGLPLGLELAASWVRLVPIEEIAEEIRRSHAFLRRDGSVEPDRHASIDATLGHSWRLLSEVERDALRKLAVFRGGFRRSAASFVSGASLGVLASLVDKSLVRAALDGRYDRHPLVHAFTTDKLLEDPDGERDARQRHAAYFARLLDEAEPHRGGPRQVEWQNRLAPESENLHSALRFALAQCDTDLSLRLVRCFRWRWWPDGNVAERRALVAEALSLAASAKHPLRMDALHIAGVLEVNVRNYEEAWRYQEEALELALAQGAHSLSVWLRTNLGTLCLMLGDRAAARSHFQASLAVRPRVGTHTGIASALNHLGRMAREEGRTAEAAETHAEALAIGRATQDTITLCRSLNGLGYAAEAAGDTARAVGHLEESLALARAHQHHASAIAGTQALARIAASGGATARAGELYRDALTRLRSTGMHRLLHRLLEDVAGLLSSRGRHIDAASVWGAADALRREPATAPEPADDDVRQSARQVLGPSAFDAAWRRGAAWGADGAIAHALDALDALASRPDATADH